MASNNNDYYTIEEVDKLIADAKKEIESEAEKIITVTNDGKAPAKSSTNRLWINVL